MCPGPLLMSRREVLGSLSIAGLSSAAEGVTALRLFARARVGNDVLDLCGKLNPELKQVFHRAYAAARPYGIRFLQQILPEPGSSCYVSRNSIERRVLPRFLSSELARLTPSQRRFMQEAIRRLGWEHVRAALERVRAQIDGTLANQDGLDGLRPAPLN